MAGNTNLVKQSFVGEKLANAFTQNFVSHSINLDKTCDVFKKHIDRIEQDQNRIGYANSAIRFEKSNPEASSTFKKSSKGVYEKLTDPKKTEEKDKIFSGIKKDKKLLIEMREVCALSIEAKQHYYNHSFFGKIAKCYQNICKKLGYETPLEKAERLLNTCDRMLNGQYKDRTLGKIDETLVAELNSAEFNQEAQLQTQLGIMRSCAMTQQRVIHLLAGATPANPKQMLVAKPNGDVLVIGYDEDSNQKGSGRYIYQTERYSVGKPKEKIAVMSSYPYFKFPSTLEDYLEYFDDTVAQVNEKIKKEVSIRSHLIGVSGIIDTHSPAKINEENTDFMLAEMSWYPLGSLRTFLGSEKGKNLSEEQKKHLINCITRTVNEMHSHGVVHRDLKLDNILIVYNEKNGLYESVIIDLEEATLIKEDQRKFASTVDCWPPEYARVFVEKRKVSTQEVPAESLDYWTLGLVIYQIWNGEDYVKDQLQFNPLSYDPDIKASHLNERFNDKSIQELPKETPIDRLIAGLLDRDPKTRHLSQESIE